MSSFSPEKYHILIVDDEEDLRESIKINFEMDGYNVHVASGGREALEIVKRQKVDFIISDIRMPDGDGEELLHNVRAHNPELPVIVLITGFSEFSREEALKSGALDLLSKPVDMEKLEEYVRNSLSEKINK
jgi:two-component system alkaline phosphatase synthesis response regulator PhoP